MHPPDYAATGIVDDAVATLTRWDSDDMFTDAATAFACAVVRISELGLPPDALEDLADLTVEIGEDAAWDTQDPTAALRSVARRHRVPLRTRRSRLRRLWRTRPKNGSATDLLCHLRLLDSVVTPDHRHYVVVPSHILRRVRPKVFARWIFHIRWPQKGFAGKESE